MKRKAVNQAWEAKALPTELNPHVPRIFGGSDNIDCPSGFGNVLGLDGNARAMRLALAPAGSIFQIHGELLT
jgi:hypothetical protein